MLETNKKNKAQHSNCVRPISELPMKVMLDHYAPKGKMRTFSIISDNKPEICFSIEFFKIVLHPVFTFAVTDWMVEH